LSGCDAGAVRAVALVPIMVLPGLRITVRTSSKSTLIAGHVDDFRTPPTAFSARRWRGKRLLLWVITAQHFQQLSLSTDRVHIGFQLGEAISVGHAATTFELERLGDHTHGQNVPFLWLPQYGRALVPQCRCPCRP
jgi:hypothetical protein